MKAKLYTKQNCPFCVKAKSLLTSKNIEYSEIEITTPEELWKVVPNAKTVPQIFLGDTLIGGYTELESYFDNVEAKRTVFNTENRGFADGKYPLFLGDDLGMTDTIHQPYPVLETLFDLQASKIWNHLEVDVTQDRQDMLSAPPPLVDMMSKNVTYQWAVDSVASRSITGVLMDHVSNSDLESWYNVVAFFETIHAKTYSHIVKQTFSNPTQAIEEAYKNRAIIERASITINVFDNLINMPWTAPKEERRKALYLAIVALYLLEGLNFMASFAVTFGIAERGYFQGIGALVKLICRDELIHAEGGKQIITIERGNNPKAFTSIAEDIQALFADTIRCEYEWTDYLFSEGREVIGLTPELVKAYVDYRATPMAEVLRTDFDNKLIQNPIPFMDKWIDSSKVQVANQELQNGTYLLNSVLAAKDVDSVLSKYKKETDWW